MPDPVQILSDLIADLRNKDGSLNIPGLYKDEKVGGEHIGVFVVPLDVAGDERAGDDHRRARHPAANLVRQVAQIMLEG